LVEKKRKDVRRKIETPYRNTSNSTEENPVHSGIKFSVQMKAEEYPWREK